MSIRSYRHGLALCLGLLMLTGCASSRGPSPAKTGGTDLNAQPAAPQPSASPGPQADALLLEARAFDRFLSTEMPSLEATALTEECREKPDKNPFCFSILNEETLEQKTKSSGHPSKSTSRWAAPVIPRFRHRKLTNWRQLRTAPVGAMIKGLAASSPWEIRQVRKYASKESCPDNAAIAVAATLEDLLPDRVKAQDIGKLYERGGRCLDDNPTDKETMLTRAGLFYFLTKNYQSAVRLFAQASSVEGVFNARSLYWLYRANRVMGMKKSAASALRQLRTKYPFSFHTLMALIATNRDPGEILLHTDPIPLTRSQQFPEVNRLIEQVEILHHFGFEQSASRILDWAVADSEGAEPEVKIYLSELKKEEGDYVSKISLLSDVLYKNPNLVSRRTMEQYFPKLYFPIFEKHASGIDPYFLLAIARRESAFNARAISSANARGLLQVMPQTSRRLRLQGDLLDPDSNIEVGAKYIQELLKQMNGQIDLMLAAYNAGPQRILTWVNRYSASEPVLFIDLIPFRETREYVAAVLRNYYWYRRIHQGDDKMTTQQLLQLATKN